MAGKAGAPGQPVILAVDGGGSKTDVVLLDGAGQLLGAKRLSVSSHFGLGHERAAEGLDAAIQSACRASGIDPLKKPIAKVGVYCLAGADLPVDERRIAGVLARQGWTRKNLVRNDTLAILRAGTDRGWGVGVVCGSGMNAAGVGPDGRVVRYASLGEISGDLAAGGGWLGTMAVAHAVRGEDGRGPGTLLSGLVAEYFKQPTANAVVEAIYVGRIDQRRIVDLAPVVFAAARRRDRIARGLLDRVADEVVAFAIATIKRLRLGSRDVEVILGGGVVQADDERFHARIRDGIKTLAPRAITRRLHIPPVAGAALLGLDQVDAPSSVGPMLRASLTHARLISPDGQASIPSGRGARSRRS